MGGYVACNAKYFKASKVKALTAHNKRLFDHDENVFPELSGENFRHEIASFSQLEKQMLDAKKAAGLRARGFQESANVMIDNVLILSRDVVNELKRINPDGYKEELKDAAIKLSERIKKEFGLEPMSIDFHWDEGHYEDQDGETIEKKDFYELDDEQKSKCEFKNNYHAHMAFFNFDFKKLNQPLREMRRGDFSKIQDLAADCFEHLGFERGISKKITGNKHLEKSQYLIQKLKNQINEMKEGYERQKLTHELELLELQLEKDKENQKLSQARKELENINAEKEKENQKLNQAKQELENFYAEIEHNKKHIAPKLRQAKIIADALERNRNAYERFSTIGADERMRMELKSLQNRIQELGEHPKSKVEQGIDKFIDIVNKFHK